MRIRVEWAPELCSDYDLGPYNGTFRQLGYLMLGVLIISSLLFRVGYLMLGVLIIRSLLFRVPY